MVCRECIFISSIPISSINIFLADDSKATLFSGTVGRESVDTWMEHDLPFTIYPEKDCLKAFETRTFQVTFAPTEAFVYKVRLKSHIGTSRN